jgi:hypothetical protein
MGQIMVSINNTIFEQLKNRYSKDTVIQKYSYSETREFQKLEVSRSRGILETGGILKLKISRNW